MKILIELLNKEQRGTDLFKCLLLLSYIECCKVLVVSERMLRESSVNIVREEEMEFFPHIANQSQSHFGL